jgi:hypothetical protein
VSENERYAVRIAPIHAFGGLNTEVLCEDILTEAENWDELKENINDTVKCHFDKNEMPSIIRLQCNRINSFQIDPLLV